MFSSENLVLHDTVSTLELKGGNPRWYPKEAIVTDRALYLYKEKSDYVHDPHQRIDPQSLHARLATAESKAMYEEELPAQLGGFEHYVELAN